MAMMGKVLEHEGRFFIEVENRLEELDPMLVGGVEVLQKLAGQEVELVTQDIPWIAGVMWDKVRILCYIPPIEHFRDLFAEHLVAPVDLHAGPAVPHVYAAASRRVKFPRGPLCYIPAPWVIRGVEDVIRKNLLEQFRVDEIITQEVYERLIG